MITMNAFSVGRLWKATAAATIAIGLGCTPSGDDGGRIDSHTTTRSDKASTSANIASMLEFCDTTAQAIVKQIADIPEFSDAKYRLVIEMGSLQNKTRTPTADFEMIQSRLRSRLINSKVAKANFRFVESRKRANAEIDRVEGGSTPDLLQDGTGGGTSARYDPKLTYVMTGDFFEAIRGDRRQYSFEIKLTNLASRDIVFSEQFDLGQVTRH